MLADVVIGSPMTVIPRLLDHFDTDNAAWLNGSAMLAGAIWSPLLAKSADVYGKRRVLISTLLLACAGSLLCLAAPAFWIFLLGRFFQGAAFAAVFLSVALVLQICTPQVAMAVVGLVTSSSSVVGIIEPFLMMPVIEHFGHRGVFAAAAVLAAAAALGVRLAIPESSIRSAGRIDVGGALLLGAGMGGVLAYISLGGELGWLSPSMALLLGGGMLALSCWAFRTLRIDEPIIDIGAITRPILLTLLALVLAAGSFRSLLALVGLIAHVPPELGAGYGLGSREAIATLFATANLGIAAGGIGSGWLAGRIGPAKTLLGGIAVGTVAAFAMLPGVSVLPLAVACGGMLGLAAGAIGASGYNLAAGLAVPERQGTTAGLVSVFVALGSATFTVTGAVLLRATQIPGAVIGGAPVSSATGVHLYVALAGGLFVLAAVPAIILVRGAGRTAPPSKTSSRLTA
ncbi:MFS transporter [Mycolicibacterium diernhoferi]|uniref:MFS transporter n=1 Tax=Mycolicibacterium diernhoferi TaxID=1801 RepID=UPI001F3DAA58|nr:MFS transporter [Mycolicibacterium diernhoferi]